MEPEVEISQDILIPMYKRMLLSRMVEEKIIEMYRAGLHGLYHLYIGQEAVAVGVCSNLNTDDYILSTHRGKGHYIAKGGDLKALMAEFMEKTTGCNRGKGGPMHIVDPAVGMLGANGIVGASTPLACGAALSAKVRNSGQVVVSFFGDGAANSGPCHESMNLAGIWNLPMVFVCENNLYQVSVPCSRHSAAQDLYIRAAGYGFPGYPVDGMDIVAVYNAARQAVNRARSGAGPTLLECKTYRFRGHSEADPTQGRSYRDAQEMASWEEKCPIKQARVLLKTRGWGTDAQLQAIEQQCLREIEEALLFAKNSPDAPPEWALADVFAAM
jgi:acetoin:2,6-dichlorophenolindophenol oxidoreductase subunit alpha